jgi:hypothetical protein
MAYGSSNISDSSWAVYGIDKIQTVNVRIAKDIAGLRATTAGCDAIRSADIPAIRAMPDRRIERHFL